MPQGCPAVGVTLNKHKRTFCVRSSCVLCSSPNPRVDRWSVGCHSVTQGYSSPKSQIFHCNLLCFFRVTTVAQTAAATTDKPHLNEWENLCSRQIAWFGLNAALDFILQYASPCFHFNIQSVCFVSSYFIAPQSDLCVGQWGKDDLLSLSLFPNRSTTLQMRQRTKCLFVWTTWTMPHTCTSQTHRACPSLCHWKMFCTTVLRALAATHWSGTTTQHRQWWWVGHEACDRWIQNFWLRGKDWMYF